GKGTRVLHIEQPVLHMDGWHLHLLQPVSAALARATLTAQALTLLLLVALALSGRWAARRWRRARDVQGGEDAPEAEVGGGAGEVRNANARLRAEGAERQRADARVHAMQDELVEANKQALVGQVTAGVAHDINQAVGAIR